MTHERKASLQHKVSDDGPFSTEHVPLKETERPWKGRTVSGYGRRLPTHYMVKWRGRWYRVLCICFSNAGTYYIRTKDGDAHKGTIVVNIW